MNFWNKLSMKVKIMVMAWGIVLAYGAGSFIQSQSTFKEVEKTNLLMGQAQAQALDAAIAAQFFERYGDIQAFAMNPDVMTLSPDNMNDDLDTYVGLYGIYDVIMVVDKTGKFVASNSKDTAGKSIDKPALANVNYANAPWFKNVIDGKTTDDKAKGFSGTFFEDFQVDPVQKLALNDNRWSTSFSAAIKNGKGEVVGVITNRANSKWVENEFVLAFENLKSRGLDRGELKLVNAEGKIVLHHFPAANGGKNEVQHNFDLLGKLELRTEHPDFADYFAKNDVGVTYSWDDEAKEYQAVGFAHMKDPKFVDSIGWSAIVMNNKDQILENVHKAEVQFYIFALLMTVLSGAVAWWFAVAMAKKLSAVTDTLNHSSDEVASASSLIADQATKISEASTEQAAAIQETMAAVDEISAMVEKNAESAEKSKTVSQQSQTATERGKRTVENMLAAINEISQSNDQIAQQMESNNKQIGEVVKLISDIGQKTKVINDIVFQTKLLSFNASVEAARAGEYGKGFAVVAEEVGNLAQMSGNAAKEITAMLDESVRQAENIVKETQARVDKLVSSSREKVNLGIETSQQCNEALTEISENVNAVNVLVSEISVASKEQASGIREISSAVGQLDVATQENAAVAQRSSTESDNLNNESQSLRSVIRDLIQVVEGRAPNGESYRPHGEPKHDSHSKPHKKLSLVKPKHDAHPAMPAPRAEVKAKAVSGSDVIPQHDDSRFEEV